ncbi:MAG: helix-hairpin-helix domain-containing protein [Candidatus Omnitrophota bacterium]|jgi:competence ComEA-like helix-hairpin-helix protein
MKYFIFSLTPQERRVVLFLTGIALLGIGADFLLKKYFPGKAVSSLSCDIGKVDLNSADKELLMEVPGIGDKLAGRIIEYRKKQEAFYSIEELKNIKGIGNYKYERIKDAFIVR